MTVTHHPVILGATLKIEQSQWRDTNHPHQQRRADNITIKKTDKEYTRNVSGLTTGETQ